MARLTHDTAVAYIDLAQQCDVRRLGMASAIATYHRRFDNGKQ